MKTAYGICLRSIIVTSLLGILCTGFMPRAQICSVSTEKKLIVDHVKAGKSDFSPIFSSGLFSVTTAQRTERGRMTVDLYFDRMIAEVFMDNGTECHRCLPGKALQQGDALGKRKALDRRRKGISSLNIEISKTRLLPD